MAEKKRKYFVSGGSVPQGKEGNLVWSEEHAKGGAMVWYSKPVSQAELPSDVEKDAKKKG